MTKTMTNEAQEPTYREIGRVLWIKTNLKIRFLAMLVFGFWLGSITPLPSLERCNIAVIPIQGEITNLISNDESNTVVDTTVGALTEADKDSSIAGIMLQIDSPGGFPVASEVITVAIKRSNKPVVGLIREMGTSGAYMAASAADYIIAPPYSDVGSIGLTMSYLENVGENLKNGRRFIELVAGRFKEMANPDKPLSNEERSILQRDLNILHKLMIEEISKNRNISVEEVIKLADGSSMPGIVALEKGLIDELGDEDAARAYFAKSLGVSLEEVVVCD